MWFKIVNDGEIELEALTLLGASTKDGETTIGRFGSGNKYAIACLLREGINVRIFSGTREFTVSTQPCTFRDQHFDRILINDKETSMTTRTGPDWEPWMAMREFICNAIDEGGFTRGLSETPCGVPGKTSVFVDYIREIRDFEQNISSYLWDGIPLYVAKTEGFGSVGILPNQSGHVFRKGIRAYKLDSSLFSYDIEKIAINESRLIDSDWRIKEAVATAWAVCQDAEQIKMLIRHIAGRDLSQNGTLEQQLCWDSSYCYEDFSEAWHSVLKAAGQEIITESMWQSLPGDERIVYLRLSSSMVKKLRAEFPDLPFYGEKEGDVAAAMPSKELVSSVNSCKKMLKACGLPLTIPLFYVRFASKTTLARLIRVADKGDTRPAPRVEFSVETPLEMVSETLLEELAHHLSGCADGTRGFETFLIKRWFNAEMHAKEARAQLNRVKSGIAIAAKACVCPAE